VEDDVEVPGVPPPGATSPLPARRKVWPSSTPGGTVTARVEVSLCTRRPLHSTHASRTTLPSPRQRGHTLWTMKKPWLCTTWPRPLHDEQVSGLVPARAPEP
jgi:hypothetical protein